MFVLCPHCQFLVALDPISGEPPLLCPRCAGRLQPDDATAADHDQDAGSVQISDKAIAGEAIQGESPTDEPATVEPVIAAPGVVGPDTLELGTPEAGTVEPAAAGPPSEHAPADADPAVEGDVVPTPGDADDQDPNPIGTRHFDPVEDAKTPATEPADALIEAMPDPATIEIEAAAETSGQRLADPVDEPPTDAPQSSGNGAGTAPGLVIEDLEPAAGPAADPTPVPAAGTEEPPADGPRPPGPAPRKPVPSFVRRPPAVSGIASRWRRRTAVAIAVLTLGLLLQLLLADRARLAADARWRPAVSTLCDALHCTLPPWREPAAITLLRRDVRPHPTIRGALQVTATFRNDARWAQPWPGVLLTLSDVDGRAVAARTFLPREYLAARTTGAAAAARTLASGHSKTIVLDIVEPTPRIVAFTFDFR